MTERQLDVAIGDLRENNFSGMAEADVRLLWIEAWMGGEEVEIVSVDYSLIDADCKEKEIEKETA